MTVADERTVWIIDDPSTLPQLRTALACDRRLPVLIEEAAGTRWIWIGMMLIVCALYAGTLYRLWAPADSGVDQNAYLVGGRMIAKHFTTRYDLPGPYAYIGNMFDRGNNGHFYPKYGFGLPLLYAICLWVWGPVHGVNAAFTVSPACAVLAVLGMFFLARLAAGSFAAVCAAILLACSQVTLLLANNPNSHASCLAFIVWGMYCLVRWWQTGSIWRGIIGGFLLGYAGCIRYSEGLLVLPIAVAAACRLRWSDWRSYIRCAIPGLAWAGPILTLLIYNKLTLGEWTGYDSNNESEFGSAFTWAKFQATWEEMLRTVHDMGMFFTLPLGVAGLAMLFRKNWQLATVMLAWVLPGIALYTSYYWSPDRGVSYARFFLTFFPGLFVGVAVCFSDGILGGKEAGEHPLLSIPLDVAVGLVVSIAAGVGVYRAINGIEAGAASPQTDLFEQQRMRWNLSIAADHLRAKVPPHSLLFAEEGGMGSSPVNFFQFAGDWDLYAVSAFSPTGGRRGVRIGPGGFGGPGGAPGGGPGGMNRGGFGGGRFGGGNNGNANNNADQPTPSPMQPALRSYIADLYKSKSSVDLLVEEKSVIDSAIDSGKRVFIAAADAEISSFESSLKMRMPLHATTQQSTTQTVHSYVFKPVDQWKDLESPPADTTTATFGRFGGNRGGNRGFHGPDIAWHIVEVQHAQ